MKEEGGCLTGDCHQAFPLLERCLECPLDGQSGIPRECFVAIGEVVAKFPFCTYAEVEVGVYATELVEVEPQLRLGDEYGVLSVCIAVVPEVGKARSCEQATTHVVVPCGGELERVAFLHFGEILIQRHHSETRREVLIVPRVAWTDEVGIVVGKLIARATIVLDVGGNGSFPKLEFTGNFPIGRLHATVLIVHIHEEESVTPLVGTEHFDRSGQGRTTVFVLVEMAKVVVQLHVLSHNAHGRHEGEREKK